MNPLGTRARVEEFARLLDGAVAGPGAATAGHAALAIRLRTLAPEVSPRAEFRATLRTRLVAVATVQADAPAAVDQRRTSPTQARKVQRRMGVLAGSMAGIVAFTGISIASSQSLPGAPFYSLKRGAEAVQLQLARGDVGKGTAHLEFAATRLREVQAMAAGERTLSVGAGSTTLASGTALGRSIQAKITKNLGDFDRETREGTALLLSAYRDDGKVEALQILSRFSSEQRSRLTALIPSLPPAVSASARSSLALVNEVGKNASEMLAVDGSCSGGCDPAAGGPQLPDCKCATPTPTPGTSGSGQPSPSGSRSPGNPGPTAGPTGGPPGGPAVPTSGPSANPVPPPEPPAGEPVPVPTVVAPQPTVLPVPTLPLPVSLPPLPLG